MEDISKTGKCITLNKNIIAQSCNQTSKLKRATLLIYLKTASKIKA